MSKAPIIENVKRKLETSELEEVSYGNCISTACGNQQREVEAIKPTNHLHQKTTRETLETDKLSAHI